MEENETTHLVRIGIFGTDTVVQRSDPGTYLVQEFWRGMGRYLADVYPAYIGRPEILRNGFYVVDTACCCYHILHLQTFMWYDFVI